MDTETVSCEVCGGPVFLPACGQPESNRLFKVKCDEKNKQHCWLWSEMVYDH